MHKIINNKIYRVAIYIRLSKEDDNEKKDSESVINQRNILLKFVKENKYKLVDIYIDDGYTGTNFDRPAFQKMIKDIEQGKIDMVVTKDLSRLGRDYITTGEYIEKWFPKHNVRYVSLLDGVDTITDTSNNEIAPFKAIINDMYSRDNSKKIKAALKSKQELGKWVGGCPPFGYKVDPNDKNHLIINEEEALIVKKIFYLALEGKNINQIKNKLFYEKIPTPSIIRNTNRINKYAQLGYWSDTTIKSILSNDLYTGDMVQNRRSRISYKIRNIIHNDKSEWIIVPNTHKSIINRKEFEEIQRILKISNRLREKKNNKGIFDGLIYCGDCKKKITLQKSKSDYCYTICNTYKKYSKLNLCTSHSYNFSKLESLLIQEIKKTVKEKINREQTVNNLIKNVEKLQSASVFSLKQIEKSIEIKKRYLDKIYIDKLEEYINEEQYIRLKCKFNSEIKILEDKKNNMEKISDIEKKCGDLTNQILGFEKINRDIIIRLISKIELYQDKTINIYFNFKNK